MPNKNRLLKRQLEYLKAAGIFLNPDEDDEAADEKRAVADQLRQLNRKLEEISPYNEDGTVKDENKLNQKMSEAEVDALINLYQKSLDAIYKLVVALNEQADSMEDDIKNAFNTYEAKEIIRNQKSVQATAEQFDKIAKTMSKDLRALNLVKQKKKSISLDSIFESSRVNSEYTVVGEVKASNRGAQNDRIPLTIVGKDGKPIKGYFTRDNKPKIGGGYVDKAIRDTRKKYGKDAKYLSTYAVKTIYNQLGVNNKDAFNTLLGHPELISMMAYKDAVKYLSEGMPKGFKSYIDTPQKLNMFVDVMHHAFAVQNQQNISEGIGINSKSNVNRRNAAMSKMAELLGCPDILANSENIRIKINGKNVKGTFMKEAIGEDCNKIHKDSLILNATTLSSMDVNLKKQIANLQIIDYLCGNPDRHSGNMLYYFEKGKDGLSYLKRIQGIDNDSAFGATDYKFAEMSSIRLENMKVIPTELANKVMNLKPDALKQMLYGFDLTTREINNALKRLTTLQEKLTKDAAEYMKGYTKGYIIPGTIKTVDDEELSEITLANLASRKEKKENRNLFERISNILSPVKNLETYYSDTMQRYEKAVYDYTVGSVGKMGELISDLNRDYRFGGSSTPYDKMHDDMKSLNKSLVSFTGPVCGSKVNTYTGHVQELMDIREKIRQTLMSVNEYIFYKDSKKKGEEWRNIEGPHEPSRTERRYHDAINCRKFLNEQLDKFEELLAPLEEYNEVKRTYKKSEEKAKNNELAITRNEDYVDHVNKHEENLYANHVSRMKYEIKATYDKISTSLKEWKPYYKTKYDMLLGYAIFGLEDKDKEAFRDSIEELTGKKIDMDNDTLIKRALASNMVMTKATCLDTIKQAERNPKKKVSSGTYELLEGLKYVEASPFDEAVDHLLNNDVFDDFFEKFKDDISVTGRLNSPGVAIPDFDQTKKMLETYNKELYKKHPQLAPKPEPDKVNGKAKKNNKAPMKKS